MSSIVLPPPEVRRAIRRAAGCSMADLAAEMHVSRQSISFWERGLIEPSGAHASEYVVLLDRLRAEAAATLASAEDTTRRTA